MNIQSIKDLDISGKKVLIRVDFNVPLKNGKVVSDVRIRAALPTIQYVLSQNAKVMLMSHLGRPVEGEYDEESTLQPVAKRLSELLGQPVKLEKHWLSQVLVKSGEVVMCENVRFNTGEKKNNEALGRKMAQLCDVFVMDAFATSHRAQASTYGVAQYAPQVCAGLLLTKELKALGEALQNPAKPLAAIVGGAKVSSKLTVLENLVQKVQVLIVGGGIANTFLVAAGHNVGASLYEKDLVSIAEKLIRDATQYGCEIPLPIDVRVATEFSEFVEATVKQVQDVEDKDIILDIGPKTEEMLAVKLKDVKTIVWNGPLGVFEFEHFGDGTKALAEIIAKSSAFSLAGGGDTIAAIEKYNIQDDVSYISTAGGAFLEFLEGKALPAVEILKERSKEEVKS